MFVGDQQPSPGRNLAPTTVMQVWAHSVILETALVEASWHDPRCCDRCKVGRVMMWLTVDKSLSVRQWAAIRA